MSSFNHDRYYVETMVDSLRHGNSERRHEDRVEEIAFETVEDGEKPRVVSVDLKAKDNALNCNCEKFELVNRRKATAVIRRGGTLLFDITFNKDADCEGILKVQLYFSFGPSPSVVKNTQAILLVTGNNTFDKNVDEWDVRFCQQEGNTATVEVQIPHHVPVGVWKLAVEVSPREDEMIRDVCRLDDHIYILFNPWNKDDEVYLEEEELCDEYVLNDIGKVWMGYYGKPWNFGQFDDVVLPACVYLIEKANLKPDERGDAVKISRAISKMVNSNDDNGVLVGKWDSPYHGGIPPTHWTGSIKILEQYLTTGRPVKYGQCWVFGCLVNTVCRALGIPCRVVTNLNSAHDTNNTLTIDEFVDEKGVKLQYWEVDTSNIIGRGVGDSVWNFHVWNDVWMARWDLPDGFGGWQAIDATPQETSNGIYQCGPASHVAIKTGQTHLNYDVSFVLAEVNADVVTWKRDETQALKFKKLWCDKKRVGKEIITKKPGEIDYYYGQDKELVNESYKSAESTDAERIAMNIAARRTRTARHAFEMPSESIDDVTFHIEDVERVPIGEEFTLSVTAKNTGEESRTVAMKLTACSEYYNGAKGDRIKWAEGTFTLDVGEERQLSMPVSYSEYYGKLVEYCMIRLTSLCYVEETTQSWIGEDVFQVIKPRINIEVPETCTVGKAAVVRLSFSNPLETSLRSCSLEVDGPGLTRPKNIPVSDVEAKGEMSYELKLYPKRGGRRTIIVNFNSTQLVDLTGSIAFDVVESDA